jgi:hypothetical protein
MSETTRHFLYGSTNDSSCVPDASAVTDNSLIEESSPGSSTPSGSAPSPSESTGCVFDADGDLVLTASFGGGAAPTASPFTPSPVSIEGRYLADALALWDSYRNGWMPASPLLLRFEDGDVVFSRTSDRASHDNAHIVWWEGSLDTGRPVRLLPSDAPDADEVNDQVCLQWVPLPHLAHVLGQQVTDTLARDRGIDIAFENASVHLTCRNGNIEASVTPGASQ